MDEITSLLTERLPKLSNVIILGDFNINTRDTTSADDTIFNNSVAALRLEQHIHSPTHRLENTLDLIFPQLHREVKVTNATTHRYISDHCMLSIDLQLHTTQVPEATEDDQRQDKNHSQGLTNQPHCPNPRPQ